jgi:hypothetical protein
MAEKNVSEDVETPETEVVEESTVTEQDKTEKTFKQADMDRVVQTRVNQEKNKFKTERDQWAAEKATYEEQISGYEKIVQGLVDAKKKDLPPAYAKIIEKLPLFEQLDFLNDSNNSIVEKKPIPKTPNGGDDSNTPKSTNKIKKFL